MKLRRPLTWAVLVPVLLAGVVLANSTRKRGHTLDPLTTGAASADEDPDQRFLVELSVRDSAVLRRIAIKNQIAADLVHGRMRFPEAVARFQAILARTPVIRQQLREIYPGLSEEECVGRSVICFAAGAIDRLPRQDRQAVMRRLARELRTHLTATASPSKSPPTP